MSTHTTQTYATRETHFEAELAQLQSRQTLIASFRALVFVAMLVLLILFVKKSAMLGITLPIAFLFTFIYLVQISSRLQVKLVHLKNLIKINQDEQKAVAGDFSAFKTGSEYMDYHHAYSYDLDVFGDHSIYRMLDRTGTIPGSELLAEELKNLNINPERIRLRQKAIGELANELDWRQQFLATARQIDFEKDETRELRKWLDGKDYFRKVRFFKIPFLLVPIISFGLPVLIAFSLIPVMSVLYYIVPLAIVAMEARNILAEQNRLGRFVKLFKKYGGLLYLLEQQKFSSGYLLELKKDLVHHNLSASLIVKRLSGILWGLESRNNLIMAFLLNAFFLWDLRYMVRLEEWREKFGKEFEKWIMVIAAFEVMNSLANIRYNRDDMVFPEVLDEGSVLEIIDGGHPLIEPSKRVDNSLTFSGKAQIKIVTGANMAGKSTLLRTVGVNMILGTLGGVVCAKSLRFHPVRIRTSVRTNDSLGDNESYFYAELVKLGKIMDELREDQSLFVIVDEMLKGTNSTDKHTGSVGLVKQMIRLGGSGLVATHDVDLGRLKEEYPENIENKCFEVKIEGEQLFFDYLLQDGISKNLNATFLMTQMGILE